MDLKTVIYEYIKNKRINYAIMINGEWGSGKTFFVKNNIIKKYDNSLYISLYDVNSIDMLSEKIYLEILKSKAMHNFLSNIFKKLYKKLFFKILLFIPVTLFKIIFKILNFIYASFFKIIWLCTCNIVNLKFNFNISSLTKKDFYGILKTYKKIGKYILVIDDLERCGIPIEETLGFLNDFVEHNNMKCIIVANEEEINKTNMNNIELKVLTATSDKINFSNITNDKNNINNTFDTSTDKKLDYKDIKDRIEYIYNDNNKYKIIKEKLIGKEFLFIPNLDDIYDKIAFKYGDNYDFYYVLNSTKHSVLNIMEFHNFNNIRILDFYFENFFKLYCSSIQYIENCNIDKEYIYSCLSSSIINGCILLKKGIKLNLLPDNKFFDYITYEKNELFSSKIYLTFDYVNEYLIYNYIEKSNIEKTINEFANSNCDKLREDDPFNILNEYYFYSSIELEKILKKLLKNIKESKYNSLLYGLIIKKISYVETIGFKSKTIDNIVDAIKEKIIKGEKVSINEYDIIDNESASIICSRHFTKIKDELEKYKNNIYEKEVESVFESKEWGVEFYEFVKDNKNTYINNKKFFSTFNNNNIIKLLMKSNIKDVYYFKYTLDYVYSFSNLKDYYYSDLESLKEFQKSLESELQKKKITDPMLKYPFDLLIEKTNDIIKKLED